MNPTQFYTSVAFPGYLPDCDTADEPIDADCLADNLRDEWQRSLESEAARRESEGSPMDDWEYAERESVGERIAQILRLGLVDPSVGINAELPDGQVWEAVGA